MQISPLQLESYHFTEMVLTSHESGNTVAPEHISTQITGGESPDDPHVIGATLTVAWDRTDENDLACNGRFSVRGAFRVANEIDMTQRLDLMRVNAVSLLYGAVREMVHNMSSRSMTGPLILPTLSFVDLPGQIQEVTDADSEGPASQAGRLNPPQAAG